ncbi:MAG: radical SAM family heme chaperone HemW [Pseudomonadota bacterium]
MDKTSPAGLYIHIPFCLRKCPYCDFYSQTDLSLIPAYIKALLTEMRLGRSKQRPFAPFFDTLYLGGGTPSLLNSAQLAEIISTAFSLFSFASDPEITIEVNPGALTSVSLGEVRSIGINRINIGVQSFDDSMLCFLGRIHTSREARAAISAARDAGFDNIGIDLIYALPGQSLRDWLGDLDQAMAYAPEHISCYMLTIEPKTLFGKRQREGKICAMPDEAVADFFYTTSEYLKRKGYSYYEISNFAREKRIESRHNKKYWSHAPYLGLGASAHSFNEPMRWWNHKSLNRYINDLECGKLPIAGDEALDASALLLEHISLGLRTTDGISIEKIRGRFDIDLAEHCKDVILGLEDKGLIEIDSSRCILTHKGRIYCDSIALQFAYRL